MWYVPHKPIQLQAALKGYVHICFKSQVSTHVFMCTVCEAVCLV